MKKYQIIETGVLIEYYTRSEAYSFSDVLLLYWGWSPHRDNVKKHDYPQQLEFSGFISIYDLKFKGS